VDAEFRAPPGERPDPVCVVARELRSGRVVRQWRGEFTPLPPYRIDGESLMVSYYASAELGVHLALNWPIPVNVLDLFAEFRNATNGLPLPAGRGLIGALAYYGLPHIAAAEKDAGRQLVMRGGPWSSEERERILAYCASDVDALAQLFARMESGIDWPRAQLRGRYMAAAARMEWTGVPVETATLARLRGGWEDIKTKLIADIDAAYGCFEGSSFRSEHFERYLASERIPWPRHPSGALDLSDDTFREMSKREPRIAPLRELRSSLAQLRLSKLAVGSDGRNRALLSAFGAKTGRNLPSNAKFIFGPSVWLRGLIRPEPGAALVYADWSSQEFGIAGALSGDERMQEAYRSGDPYLAFAKQCGAVPEGATRESHKRERDRYKAIILGTNYGMEAGSLASRLGISELEARELLQKHRETYPRFWRWAQSVVDAALYRLDLKTVFGWHLCPRDDPNPRSIRNFPMQANGAEMLRLACILATERGVCINAPVHDAVLAEAAADEIEHTSALLQAHMRTASRVVLDGFELRTDATIIRYPDRFDDPRGSVMWRRVMRLLDRTESAAHG
jgi:hypothetical protein